MKVNQAMLCLDCDEIYVGDVCPSCLSRTGYPIRKNWLLPLYTFEDASGIKLPPSRFKEELVNVRRKRYEQESRINLLQAESERSLQHDDSIVYVTEFPNYKFIVCGEKVLPREPSRLAQDHFIKSSKPEIGTGYNSRGEQMESEGCFRIWSDRINAGHAFISKTVRILQSGLVQCREKYHRRVQDPENVSTSEQNT